VLSRPKPLAMCHWYDVASQQHQSTFEALRFRDARQWVEVRSDETNVGYRSTVPPSARSSLWTLNARLPGKVMRVIHHAAKTCYYRTLRYPTPSQSFDIRYTDYSVPVAASTSSPEYLVASNFAKRMGREEWRGTRDGRMSSWSRG
jgi:hypothetical protein